MVVHDEVYSISSSLSLASGGVLVMIIFITNSSSQRPSGSLFLRLCLWHSRDKLYVGGLCRCHRGVFLQIQLATKTVEREKISINWPKFNLISRSDAQWSLIDCYPSETSSERRSTMWSSSHHRHRWPFLHKRENVLLFDGIWGWLDGGKGGGGEARKASDSWPSCWLEPR